MSHNTKPCPGCGQALRIPEGVGGVAMACPNCGQRIPSFFKLGGVNASPGQASAALRPAPQKAPAAPDMRRAANIQEIQDISKLQDVSQSRTPLLAASGLNRYKLMMRQG